MVFTFKKETNNVISGESYTDIQEAIFGAATLQGIAMENLPNFRYF